MHKEIIQPFGKFLLILMITFCATLISAQEDASIDKDSSATKGNFFQRMIVPDSTQLFRFKLLPILTYSPETRLGLGAGFVFYWDYATASPGTNSSLAQSFFYFTQNNQIDWTSILELYTNENRFFISGKIGYLKFPQYYYGVGNDLIEEEKESFSFNQLYVDLRNRVLISHGIYVGLDYYFNSNYNLIWKEDSRFANDPFYVGTEGYLLSGIGPEITYDTRDFPFNPLRGSYISALMLVFSDALGSEYKYNSYQLDLRHFIPINKKKKWVIAVNLYGLFAKGEVPFNRLPALGGSQIMRGYYSGRFRDHNYIAGQLEWRMPIWKIIALRTWVGAGQVAANFDQFHTSGFKANIGVGIRVEFDKKSRSTIRLDQGFGESQSGFYLKINEAF